MYFALALDPKHPHLRQDLESEIYQWMAVMTGLFFSFHLVDEEVQDSVVARRDKTNLK